MGKELLNEVIIEVGDTVKGIIQSCPSLAHEHMNVGVEIDSKDIDLDAQETAAKALCNIAKKDFGLDYNEWSKRWEEQKK